MRMRAWCMYIVYVRGMCVCVYVCVCVCVCVLVFMLRVHAFVSGSDAAGVALEDILPGGYSNQRPLTRVRSPFPDIYYRTNSM